MDEQYWHHVHGQCLQLPWCIWRTSSVSISMFGSLYVLSAEMTCNPGWSGLHAAHLEFLHFGRDA
eukprot:5439244-Amphidinium_carterae.1